jgi:hypothetical protein
MSVCLSVSLSLLLSLSFIRIDIKDKICLQNRLNVFLSVFLSVCPGPKRGVGAPLATIKYCAPHLSNFLFLCVWGGGGCKRKFVAKCAPLHSNLRPLTKLVKFAPFFDMRPLRPALATALCLSVCLSV